ncbi:auxin efflux carrier [Phlyctochytrium arcticum]|nr:auxin efflux carrier [Phlyctochytrium arcticum]
MDWGQVAWVAVRSILKLFLLIAFGVLLTKTHVVNRAGAKAIASLVLLGPYPLLLFTKMVSGLNSENVSNLGILTGAAVLYTALGWGLGALLARLLKPPLQFWNGYIMAMTLGNFGDIPLAVTLSLGDQAPFKKGDSGLGVAYLAGFLCFTTLFSYSVGSKGIADDFRNVTKKLDVERVKNNAISMELLSRSAASEEDHGLSRNAASEVELVEAKAPPVKTTFMWIPVTEEQRFWLTAIFNPANIGIILGIIIGVVQPLKHLFVYPDHSEAESLSEPKLQFIFEVMQQIGNCAVPLSVMNLGIALGNLKLHSFIAPRLIASITIVRLLIIPVIGIGLCELLVKTNVIDAENKILRFVLMFTSCVPTAAATVAFTQYWSPAGEADEIASVMLVEYIFAFFTMTGTLIFIFYVLM